MFELREDGARLRVVKPIHLMDLYGALPATRPYPGKEAIREEVGRALGRAMDEHLADEQGC